MDREAYPDGPVMPQEWFDRLNATGAASTRLAADERWLDEHQEVFDRKRRELVLRRGALDYELAQIDAELNAARGVAATTKEQS